MSEPVDAHEQFRGTFSRRWTTVRFGALFTESQERNTQGRTGQPLSVSEYRGVVERDETDGQMVSEDVSAYRVVRPGQLAANVMWLNRSGLGVSPFTGFVSPAYKVYDISEDLNSRFVHYLLRSSAYRDEFERFGRGVRPNAQMIDTADLRGFPIPVPPLDEQRAIADFLDRETAKIDPLVEKQSELITLLRERRTATITQMATLGLSSANTRASENRFLGDIPRHWIVSHFALEMTVNGGLVDPQVAPWSNMVLIAPNHIESNTGKLIGRETAAEQGAESGKYLVRKGQIMYSKIRPALNKVAIAVEDCLCSADMYAMSSRKGDDPRYLAYFMLSRPFHLFASEVSERVKMPKINRDELGAAPWLRPPLDEQREIADFLDRETAKIDALIGKATRHVALAQERRAALITAAVTGQIDVTGKAA